MKRPARRTIVKVLFLLIAWGAAGAALNVAVAWGLCQAEGVGPDIIGATTTQLWERFAPDDFVPAGKVTVEQHKNSLGYSRTSYSGILPPHDLSDPATLQMGIFAVAGWPMRSQLGYYFATQQPLGKSALFDRECTFWRITIPSAIGSGRIWLPKLPLWPGFAVNTLFYAGVLWTLFCAPFALRRLFRRRRGRCPACAYPIGQSPVCTECGASHAGTPKAINA